MIEFNEQQIILVSGASSGIGKATALLLNKLGAKVIGLGRNEAALAQLVSEAKFPDKVFTETRDLSKDIDALPSYMLELSKKYGKLYGVVCSAGITEICPLRSLDYQQMQLLFNIDYFAPIFMAQGFVHRKVHLEPTSSFVAISSICPFKNNTALITYSGAKASLIASMQSIAIEYAAKGIRFNTISPADIDTPMLNAIAFMREEYEKRYQLGFGKPEDVASLAAYLLSPISKWTTGQNYIIDCTTN